MKRYSQLIAHSIPNVLIFLLIGVFAVTSVVLTLIGTRVYRHVADTSIQNSDARIMLSYLSNKVRAFDVQDGVVVEEREGLSTLCLYSSVDGQPYETTIYLYNGAVCERFAPKGVPFDPADSEALMDAEALTFTMVAPNLLQASVEIASDVTQTLHMALRAQPGKEAI